MPTPAEHYASADALVKGVTHIKNQPSGLSYEIIRALIALAQVHATLALYQPPARPQAKPTTSGVPTQ